MTDPYRLMVDVTRMLLRLFFKKVEVLGRERVPTEGGGLIIAWHPNGLIDPALIVSELPRKVVFGARHGLFKFPILGRVLKATGTIPIYRAIDSKNMPEAQRREANAGSVSALAQAVAGGSFAALFPEGASHDAPSPQQLRTGAARLYYEARDLNLNASPPHIIPVGLHYDKKHAFRSRVLIEFHAPIELAASLALPLPRDEEIQRARYRQLTDEFDRVLHESVHATETWRIHRLMHRARSLIRAERAHRTNAQLDAPDMVELAAGFRRVWAGYYARRETHPDEVAALLKRVRTYDRDLSTLDIDDHELDRSASLRKRWKPLALVGQAIVVYVVAPPVLLIGYIVNAPIYIGLDLLARRLSRADKDAATIKLLGGMVLYPITWFAVSLLVAFGVLRVSALYPGISADPFTAASTMLLFCAVGGVLALFYLEMLRETWNALRTRLTRRQRKITIEYLKLERAALHDDITALVRDVTLPGELLPDGRMVPDP